MCATGVQNGGGYYACPVRKCAQMYSSVQHQRYIMTRTSHGTIFYITGNFLMRNFRSDRRCLRTRGQQCEIWIKADSRFAPSLGASLESALSPCIGARPDCEVHLGALLGTLKRKWLCFDEAFCHWLHRELSFWQFWNFRQNDTTYVVMGKIDFQMHFHANKWFIWIKINRSLCLGIQLLISQLMFLKWFATEHVICHYPSQYLPRSLTHVCLTGHERVKLDALHSHGVTVIFVYMYWVKMWHISRF